MLRQAHSSSLEDLHLATAKKVESFDAQRNSLLVCRTLRSTETEQMIPESSGDLGRSSVLASARIARGVRAGTERIVVGSHQIVNDLRSEATSSNHRRMGQMMTGVQPLSCCRCVDGCKRDRVDSSRLSRVKSCAITTFFHRYK